MGSGPKDMKQEENKQRELGEAHGFIREAGDSGCDDYAALISQKVDEKLSMIASRDEEMERQLAEIRELRRLEKEALDLSRSARREKRRKKRDGGRQEQPEPSRQRERPDEEPKKRGFAAASVQEKKAEAERARPQRAAAETAEPKGQAADEDLAKAKALDADFLKAPDLDKKGSCAEPLTEEDARVAQAVDLFFDTAEEIAKEGKNAPSRSLDKAIDGFLHGIKASAVKAGRITKELHCARKDMEDKSHLTHEKRVARYRSIWAGQLAPVIDKAELWKDRALIKASQMAAWLGERKADGEAKAGIAGAKRRRRMRRTYKRGRRLLEYAEHHKLRLFSYFAGAVACAAVIGIIIGNLTAYEYIYNGRVLGVVKNQEDVYKTIDVIGGKLSESLHADVEIDKYQDITFRKLMGLGITADSKDDVLNNLTYMKSLKAKGYAIVADGKQIAILQNQETAQSILDRIRDLYLKDSEGIEYKSVGFAQKVEIKEIDTELGNIQNPEAAEDYMLTGAVEKKVHVVQKGQTFNAIAKSYGLKPSQLEASNPGIDPAKLKIDQELVLTQDAPVLTVQTTEVAAYTEDIPFEISYEETDKIYKGDKKVKLKGENGKREVVAEIVRNNGTEVSRKELSSNIISQPIHQVVLTGTKAKPKTVATGSFSYPVRGARISSRFGSRWGRTHTGVDLAAPRGTNIYAADGGTVASAGYQGSYGYLVVINHGNGKQTYYAHCSKLLVSKGAKVYKGQVIAKVGNTGRSTGPHCHFEVRINGVPKNPLKYL